MYKSRFPYISNKEIQGYFKGNYGINSTFSSVHLDNCYNFGYT